MLTIIYILTTIILLSNCLYFFYLSYIMLLPKVYSNRLEKKDFHFKIMIPCMNEEKVILNTLKKFKALKDFNKYSIYVIDDASEDDTAKIVNEFAKENINVKLVQRVKPNAQEGKGEALNYCYKFIKNETISQGLSFDSVIIGVMDADGRISENAISEMENEFSDPKVGAAQTRIKMVNNSSLLARMQDLEFFGPISNIQKSREYTSCSCLGGNGQFSRMSSMEEVVEKRGEVWSKCLLEDFEFGLQLLFLGWKVKHLHNVITYQQGLTSYKKLIRQRSRWGQGNIQCYSFLKEIKNSKILTLGAKIELLYFIFNPFYNMFIYNVIFLDTILTFYYFTFIERNTISWPNFLVTLVVITLMPVTAIIWDYVNELEENNENNLTSFEVIKIGSFYIIYHYLLIPAAFIAMKRFLTGQNSWLKTERVEDLEKIKI
jgi:1,2-diacylglycerol 3-beta-glucosyltransferase